MGGFVSAHVAVEHAADWIGDLQACYSHHSSVYATRTIRFSFIALDLPNPIFYFSQSRNGYWSKYFRKEGLAHLQVKHPVVTLILPPVLNSMFTASDNPEWFTAR